MTCSDVTSDGVVGGGRGLVGDEESEGRKPAHGGQYSPRARSQAAMLWSKKVLKTKSSKLRKEWPASQPCRKAHPGRKSRI